MTKERKKMNVAHAEPVRITMTELKNNLTKYLLMPSKTGQKVYVTKNGRDVAVVRDAGDELESELDSLLDGLAIHEPEYTSEKAAEYYGVGVDEVTKEMLASYYKKLDREKRYDEKYE